MSLTQTKGASHLLTRCSSLNLMFSASGSRDSSARAEEEDEIDTYDSESDGEMPSDDDDNPHRLQPLFSIDMSLRTGRTRTTRDIPRYALQEEFRTLEQYDDSIRLGEGSFRSLRVGRTMAAVGKNRYPDVQPFDESVVPLPRSGHYINASYVTIFGTKYIATQWPRENTKEDFWEMIFEHRCPAIVSLQPPGRRGHTPYLPPPESQLDFSAYIVEFISSRTEPEYFDIEVKITGKRFLNQRSGGLSGLSAQLSPETFHTCHVLLFRDWPDFGVPRNFVSLRRLIDRTKTILTIAQSTRLDEETFKPIKVGPLVAHCSAGVGRSGVFLGCYAILEEGIQRDRDAGFRAVKEMREGRNGMVQTLSQYMYLVDFIWKNREREGVETEVEGEMSALSQMINEEDM